MKRIGPFHIPFWEMEFINGHGPVTIVASVLMIFALPSS